MDYFDLNQEQKDSIWKKYDALPENKKAEFFYNPPSSYLDFATSYEASLNACFSEKPEIIFICDEKARDEEIDEFFKNL